jgi:hypothetical protein
MESNKRRFPPSLSKIKSEYDVFCDKHGGPIICDDGFAGVRFEHCCREFHLQMFKRLIDRWAVDPSHGIRHWPVMAFATDQYAFRQREFNKYGIEASPAQVRDLLEEIRKSARRLSRALARFQEMSTRLSDGTAPEAKPHLSWLDEIIAQAMAGQLAADVNQDSQRAAIVHFARIDFLRRLVDVELASQEAQNRLDPKLLKRPRTSKNRALRTLVAMAKPIWHSLTGRTPSVNKVTKSQLDLKSQPDFVTFVQELANIGGGPEPTFKQVQIAFRAPRPPD